MEVSHVRNRLRAAIEATRARAQERRERNAQAERAFEAFLETTATPLARQIANALKVEGYGFTASTPGQTLRLAADRGRDDYIELALDTTGETPEVVARINRTRGSRTIEDERRIKPGASPDEITEDDLLEFFVDALSAWLA